MYLVIAHRGFKFVVAIDVDPLLCAYMSLDLKDVHSGAALCVFQLL